MPLSNPTTPITSPVPKGAGPTAANIWSGQAGAPPSGLGAAVAAQSPAAQQTGVSYKQSPFAEQWTKYDPTQIWDQWSTGDWKVPGQGIATLMNKGSMDVPSANQDTWKWYQGVLQAAANPQSGRGFSEGGLQGTPGAGVNPGHQSEITALKSVADALKVPVDELPIGGAYLARDLYLRQSEATRRKHDSGPMGMLGNLLSIAMFALNPGLGAFGKLLGGQIVGSVLPKLAGAVFGGNEGSGTPKPGAGKAPANTAQTAMAALTPTTRTSAPGLLKAGAQSTGKSISSTRASGTARAVNLGNSSSARTGAGKKKYEDIFGK